MVTKLNRSVGIGISVALVVGRAACSQEPNMDVLTHEEAAKEYVAEQANLKLPPGATWPKVNFPSDSVYGLGYGKAQAGTEWLCLWEGAYVKAKTDKERAAALKVIETLPETYVYKFSSDDSYKSMDDEMIAQAKLGDSSGIGHDYSVNC